jgi:hypothetical protein
VVPKSYDKQEREKRSIVKSGIFLLLVAAPFLLGEKAVGQAGGFSSQKAGYSVKFKDEVSPYRVMSVFALPGEQISLEVVEASREERYVLEATYGKVSEVSANKWQWQAPAEAGLYPVTIANRHSGESMLLNIFVMVPYSGLQGEHLNGYRIGSYPNIPFKQLPIYRPPRGFIEATKENEETLLAPHFKLKQFLCKQEGGYPKYLVLQERLLLKLELILEQTNENGYRCDSFNILSGYRTPYYNRLIGNVKYSRHLWGGAADIFVDENPRDDMMDDLNRDGSIDYRDAAVLYDIIDGMYGRSWYEPFVGGLARYKKNPSHGPFVHVDVRGFHARWGN